MIQPGIRIARTGPIRPVSQVLLILDPSDQADSLRIAREEVLK